MNLIDLEAFVSVVDHGSIVAAAAALHLTQSAVTRRVQNLEDALGSPLLDRQVRPLQPTPAGTETYEFAKPVLSSVGDLKAAITHNGEPSGDFRFGMSRGLGDCAVSSPIPDAIPAWRSSTLPMIARITPGITMPNPIPAHANPSSSPHS